MSAQEPPHGYVLRVLNSPDGGWINQHGPVRRVEDALRFATDATAQHWIHNHLPRFLLYEIWSIRAALDKESQK